MYARFEALIWHLHALGEHLENIFKTSAHLRHADARLGALIWHSHAVGEHW